MPYYRKRGKTWYYTVDIGKDPVTGKRLQDSQGGFKTKKAAEAAASKVITDVSDGIFVKEENVTFKEFAAAWLSFYANTGKVKPGSVTVRRGRVNKLNKFFGAFKIKDITKLMYQNMLQDLFDAGLANETIVSTHATARLIFKRAVKIDVIKADPTVHAELPKRQKTVEEIENGVALPKYMEKEELAKFLETASAHGYGFDYAVFMTLAYTGIRVGELCALKKKDIDFENKLIRITKTIHNVNNNTKAYQVVPPKTNTSIRTIEVDNLMLSVLEKHLAQLNIIRMKYRDKYHEADFVFPKIKNYPGYPDMPKNIEGRMKRLLKLANMNIELTPHSLRHTHTTLLAEAGVGLQEIMERLGHKNDETTKNVYSHVTKSMKSGAAAKFSELMRDVVKS